MGYEDNVLIRLRKTYSKDETVKILFKKLSELRIRNGALESEVEHYIHLRKESGEKGKDKRIQKQYNEIKKLKKDNEDLIMRIVELNNK